MEDNDPHKRMRRFGELCGYFYGRRFFGLETIMSDRDSDHMLLELQDARAEIDRLRESIRWRSRWDEPPPTIHGIYLVIGFNFDMKRRIWVAKYDGKWPDNLAVDHWRPIGPLPGGE